jgi:hypothetical protein
MIFPGRDGSTAAGADLDLTRRRRTYFSTSHDGVAFRSGIVVLSSGAVEALRPKDFAHAVKAMALEEMHSRIKLMIAAAVGPRGEWRTLWREMKQPGQR